MEIAHYIGIARAHWRALLAFLGLGIAAACVFLAVATPMYTAKSEVVVITSGAQTAGDLVQSNDFSQSQIRSYIAVATRPVVLESVIASLSLDVTSDALARQLSVSSPLNTTLITISASDESPEVAAAIANAVSGRLAEVVSSYLPSEGDGASRVRLEPIRSATPPTSPASPKVGLSLVLGMLAGLVLGAVYVALRRALDTRVRDSEGIEEVIDAPLLAAVAFDPTVPKQPLISFSKADSQRAETFRRIRTNVQFLRAVNHRSVVAVTSTIPGEGKTTTAVNIAIALAMAGQRICLVEADLRRPAIGRYLGLEGSVGLTTVLLGESSVSDAVQPLGRGVNVDVLLSGERPPNPSELLGSEGLKELLKSIEASYDSVVVDCAPLLPVTDGSIVASACGGAILVVASGKPTRADLKAATESLRSAGAPVLGYILNMAKGRSVTPYRYNYSSTPDKT